MTTISVSDLNNTIKGVLASSIPPIVHVEGEISNYRCSKGHIYLTLKDNESSIPVVVWNYRRLGTKIGKISDGNKVVVVGKLTTYLKGGYYQMMGFSIKVVGTGDLHADYIMLRDFFEEIGYFDPKIKKVLPDSINKVGLITAQDGAAITDFMYVLKNGGFVGEIYLINGVVQGKNCPKSIKDSIKKLDEMNLDVIVVTRGGGSFEDLFGFSHSDVVEAIYEAKTCVISAIGHEVDTMLSDLVADIRAPTPSIAAEILAKHQQKKFSLEYFNNVFKQLEETLEYSFKKRIEKLDMMKRQINRTINTLEDMLNTTMCVSSFAEIKLDRFYETRVTRCNTLIGLVENLNPNVVLEKGYTVILDSDGIRVETVDQFYALAKCNRKLKLLFKDGEISITLNKDSDGETVRATVG